MVVWLLSNSQTRSLTVTLPLLPLIVPQPILLTSLASIFGPCGGFLCTISVHPEHRTDIAKHFRDL
uniref:Uncharacterized protein n=1 Tax=Lepeophtheirus salmonis TaxID=72036 RepID=A0A0K2TZU6_LEPSM